MILDQANLLMERRQNVTTIYLTVNAAIGGAISFLLSSGSLDTVLQKLSLCLVLGAGVVSCRIWIQLIESYRKILRWWFAKLRETELGIDGISNIINQEFEEFYSSNNGKDAVSLARHEVGLARLLFWVYAVFLAGGVVFVARQIILMLMTP